jgi:L-ribulose-5-phosphate 3-epimerase UlaE
VLAGRLQLAKQLGFDFVEMSVDETDERLLGSTGAVSSAWRW